MELMKNIENKKKLLRHWFNYYGRVMYSLKTIEQFNKILESDVEGIEAVAMIFYMRNQGSSPLIIAIQKNVSEELIRNIKTLLSKNSDSPQVEKLKANFYREMHSTFQSSDPKNKVDLEDIISQNTEGNSGRKH